MKLDQLINKNNKKKPLQSLIKQEMKTVNKSNGLSIFKFEKKLNGYINHIFRNRNLNLWRLITRDKMIYCPSKQTNAV